jgi:hypothetical protein
MATYNAITGCVNLSLVRDGQGWTVTFPCWWKVSQIERYLDELELV